MSVCHLEIPLISGAVLVATPVPNKTGAVGLPTGAIQTLKLGGREAFGGFGSVPGLVSTSTPPKLAGDRFTVAVALPLKATLEVIVRRPPMPASFGVVPWRQRLLTSQTLNVY